MTCTGKVALDLTCRELQRELTGRGGFDLDYWCEPCRRELVERGVRYCRVCGCTDDDACPEGCSWVPTDLPGDLCSRCGALA